ncbi:hypothetical protein AB0383_20405 [Amycolatopsis sp. NPDC051373]|uniref:hypothetical protein n=1 Tax=Amycolatopsis sp. NPDC051373 TaxID=3155801 RepID=UPI00344D0CE4
MTLATWRTWQDYDHKVTIPEGEVNGLSVSRFEVTDFESSMSYLTHRGRGVHPGVYTKLTERGVFWMSDTIAEWRDHREAVRKIRDLDTRRVLINGLGIGMVLKAALACEHVEHVDVVEKDPRVKALVGTHYLTDPRVEIHEADAYTVKWPAGTRWDMAWHDIWPDLCTDNLALMSKLHRRYGRRVDWQGSWGRELLVSQRRRDKRMGWY